MTILGRQKDSFQSKNSLFKSDISLFSSKIVFTPRESELFTLLHQEGNKPWTGPKPSKKALKITLKRDGVKFKNLKFAKNLNCWLFINLFISFLNRLNWPLLLQRMCQGLVSWKHINGFYGKSITLAVCPRNRWDWSITFDSFVFMIMHHWLLKKIIYLHLSSKQCLLSISWIVFINRKAGRIRALSWYLLMTYQSHNNKNDHLTRPWEGPG